MTWVLALILSATQIPQYTWQANGSVTYNVTVPNVQEEVCTGWRYPVAQLPANEWPQRWSCRMPSTRNWTEIWGGTYMFPNLGAYQACVITPTETVCKNFMVIEGSGR